MEILLKLSQQFPEYIQLTTTLLKSKEDYDSSYCNLLQALFHKLTNCSDKEDTENEEQRLLEQKVQANNIYREQ